MTDSQVLVACISYKSTIVGIANIAFLHLRESHCVSTFSHHLGNASYIERMCKVAA